MTSLSSRNRSFYALVSSPSSGCRVNPSALNQLFFPTNEECHHSNVQTEKRKILACAGFYIGSESYYVRGISSVNQWSALLLIGDLFFIYLSFFFSKSRREVILSLIRLNAIHLDRHSRCWRGSMVKSIGFCD